MNDNKILWFDLDGTIYNLYKIPGWLEALRAYDYRVYNIPAYNRRSLPRVREVVRMLIRQGWTVGVISWGSMGITEEEETAMDAITREKRDWINNQFPEVQIIRIVPYGTDKFDCAFQADPFATHVLVDDNREIRHKFRKRGGVTINPNHSLVKELTGLLG